MTAKNNTKYLFYLILLSLVFLSLNSILYKAAVINDAIAPFSFTFYRLLSGMLMLMAIYVYKYKKITFQPKKNWVSSLMLFLYAISFSYAYINIDAGFGTLLLFGVVQIVMVTTSLFHKEKLSLLKITGLVVSLAGLIYLIYPRESFEIPLFYTIQMILSGTAWAFYSILGKKSFDALGDSTDNFIKASLYIIVFYFIFEIGTLHVSAEGFLLAIISGGITSALGYLIWYHVVPQMKIMTASVIQLFIPILTIALSVVFLNELLTFELIISTIVVTFGILLTIYSKKQNTTKE
ncbi:MAG: DMT family transporter [Arcobacteraceae bacterium]